MKQSSGWAVLFVLVAGAIILLSAQPLTAQGRTAAPAEFISWLPIADADRQLAGPLVEKEAGAEILLWRVHVVDEYLSSDLQRVLYHYIRVKVFDTKRTDSVGTVDLPFIEPGRILDVSGRTIKADGTIVELDRKTVYSRDLVRGGGRKVKVISFAMPAVENGAILEYRWKQAQNDNRFRYLRLDFARDLPVQKVTYFLKPLSSDFVASDQMYIIPFNCKTTPLQVGKDGWSETTLVNVPAERDEPYAPSNPNVEPWALLYYRQGNRDPQKYWNDEARKTYNEFKGLLKLDAEQKTAAAQAVAGSKNDDEKIVALINYLRKHLRLITDPDVTEAERDEFLKKLPKDRERTAAEVFKSGLAMAYEMNVPFGALATQVALDVRPILVANKGEIAVDPKSLPERYFVDDVAMGIKSGESWRVFNVSRKHLFPGMLPAVEEGMAAIVTDPKAATFIFTPIAAPDVSVEARTAKLELAADGTLSGTVVETYSGHRAEDYRSEFASRTAAQREQWFQDRIIRMFPDAEVTNLKLANVDDPSKLLRVSYEIDAPFFAQVTGKRILFQPNAFRRSQQMPFSASERRYPVQFPFAWKEVDQIDIELPYGFDLESAENPGSMQFGVGEYKLAMSTRKSTGTALVVSREFAFGDKNSVVFPPAAYQTIKKVFDEVRLRDTHMLSLREN